MRQAVAINRISDGLHYFWSMQHANLDGIHTNVFNHRINLACQHIRRHTMNGPHTARVLRSQRGNGRHAKAAKGRKCFQVSLYARTAATVRASDGQEARVLVRESLVCHDLMIFESACQQNTFNLAFLQAIPAQRVCIALEKSAAKLREFSGQPCCTTGLPATGSITLDDIGEAIFIGNRVVEMSARPGRIKFDLAVDIAHPRHYLVKTTPMFMQLKAQLTEEIRVEVQRASALAAEAS